MTISVHQPAHIPWLGYFDKIIRSDLFVYLDTVQFEKNSFINRNKIKTPNGWQWLTVPVKLKGHMSGVIKELQIDSTQNWRKKHLNAIFINYKKASRFEECFPKIERLYAKEFNYFSEMCYEHLMFWMEALGIHRKIVKSSDLPIFSKKSELILDICKYFKANEYISGAQGMNYLDEDAFSRIGTRINYQNYSSPVYPQLWGGFLSNLSIVDFYLNSGNYSLIKKDYK